MPPGSLDENIVLLDLFSQRVAALSPAAWERLRERCLPISGNTPNAIFARACLSVRPSTAPLLQVLTKGQEAGLTLENAIAYGTGYITEGICTTFGAILEVAVAVTPTVHEPGPPRGASTGKPSTDLYIDAFHRIRSSAIMNSRYEEGVHTALNVAAQAILQRTSLTPADFLSLYSWIEDEIPFATLN